MIDVTLARAARSTLSRDHEPVSKRAVDHRERSKSTRQELPWTTADVFGDHRFVEGVQVLARVGAVASSRESAASQLGTHITSSALWFNFCAWSE
jgi:hypothetical protein